jgi:hypothetical protein
MYTHTHVYTTCTCVFRYPKDASTLAIFEYFYAVRDGDVEAVACLLSSRLVDANVPIFPKGFPISGGRPGRAVVRTGKLTCVCMCVCACVCVCVYVCVCVCVCRICIYNTHQSRHSRSTRYSRNSRNSRNSRYSLTSTYSTYNIYVYI